MLAYSNGWNEVMEFLKLQGASSELGNTTFIWEDLAASISAVTKGKLCGANPLGRDGQGRTALHYLIVPSQIEEILKLDQSLVNAADQNGDTPLHLVKSVRSLDILCEHGALIDAENKWRQTPLNCALQEGNLKVAEALLGRKAKLNVSATNEEGEPFLHCFTRKQKEDAGIELLKKIFAEYAVEIDCRNSKGETCLHVVAAEWNSNKMITFLLEQNADLINLKDNLGQTALHRAFSMDKQRDLLIQKGADLSITDNEGRTPKALYDQKEDKKMKEKIVKQVNHRKFIHNAKNW
jgi:ankyrin repeat protein